MCVCVCVRERERESSVCENRREREVVVCVCVCVCPHVYPHSHRFKPPLSQFSTITLLVVHNHTLSFKPPLSQCNTVTLSQSCTQPRLGRSNKWSWVFCLHIHPYSERKDIINGCTSTTSFDYIKTEDRLCLKKVYKRKGTQGLKKKTNPPLSPRGGGVCVTLAIGRSLTNVGTFIRPRHVCQV